MIFNTGNLQQAQMEIEIDSIKEFVDESLSSCWSKT